MKKTFFFIVTVLLFTSTITSAQVIEARRVAANTLWETYGRNASNPSQMPNAVPLNPGSDIDQEVIAPNYTDLKTTLTTMLNNNGGILSFNNTAPATINFSDVIELVHSYPNRDKVRTIIIQGENITFDGMNTSSIFLVRGSVQLVIQDAVFRNANFDGQSQANLNSIFRVGGGAIEVAQKGSYSGSLRVRNCQFLDNKVSHFQGIGENQNGAAIRFNYGTEGEVFGCTFNNNKAVTGGAIGATSIEKLTIVNSTFDSNLSNGYKSTTGYMSVPEGAGALRVDRTAKPLEIYGSSFTRNSANVKVSVMEVFIAPVGGFSPGLPTNEPALVIDNCEFKNNKYNNYAGASNFERAFFAGCVVFHGNSATMKLTNSVFDNNDVGQANVRIINNFEFSNCIFANTNYLTTSDAPQQGAVFLQNVPQSGSFNNCTFYNNEPRNGARANDIMFWAGTIPSKVTLNNSIFYRENTSTNIKHVKAPLMGNGNNQYIPTANMSSFAEVSTSTSNKTNPNISPNTISDMCLGINTLAVNIGGLPDCDGSTPPPPPPAPTNSISIPGTIEVEDYATKNGTVAPENTPGGNGGQNLGFIRNGDYTEYDINVTEAGDYQIGAFVSSNGVGGNIVASVGGVNLATLVVPVNNAWHSYNVVTGSIALAAGEQTLRFTYTGSAGFLFNFEKVKFSTSTVSTPSTPSSTCSVPWNGPNHSITKQTLNWASQDIDISCATSVNIAMEVEGLTPAVMESSDYLNIFYAVDGGAEIAISQDTDGFALKTVSAANVTGNTLKIFIRGYTSWQNETYTINNIQVTSNGSLRKAETNALNFSDSVILYPNPARDNINISFTLSKREDIKITITNLMGIVVDSKMVVANAGANKYQLSTSTLKNGLYLIVVQNETNRIVKRFAVRK